MVQLLSRACRADAHAFYQASGFTPSAQGYRSYSPSLRDHGWIRPGHIHTELTRNPRSALTSAADDGGRTVTQDNP
jgi:hypothetical protein